MRSTLTQLERDVLEHVASSPAEELDAELGQPYWRRAYRVYSDILTDLVRDRSARADIERAESAGLTRPAIIDQISAAVRMDFLDIEIRTQATS